MKLKKFFLILAAMGSMTASAHTDILNENFNGDYTVNFPVMIEGDHQQPANRIQSLFMDAQGISRPWRMLKDVSTSDDGFIASHSYYSPAGKSNDWLCSRGVSIVGSGFKLTFDAQSVAYRSPARQSSLWICITENPVTSENDLPKDPTWVIENLPFGEDPDNTAGDFTSYSFPLDQWVGKTIYISFANLNEDSDILAIDNVIVRRLDPAELSVVEMPLVVKGDYNLETSIKGTMEEGLTDWTLTARFSNGQEYSVSGERLSNGEIRDFEIPFSIKADERLNYELSLTSKNADPITSTGEIRGLAFMPDHRVLLEEATGLWCGNCPIGQFTIESMMLDPEMNDKVIPVSVHVPSSAHANHLVVEDYATPLGMTVAPAFRLDREFVAKTFSQSNDTKYDPSNEASVAGTVRRRASEMTIMDINVDGEFVVNGNDTTAIRATAKVIPAISSDPEDRYAIGFILTENNVWLPNHYSWAQENYVSGHSEYGDVGGWVSLPKKVPNVRLQDVARAVYGYIGIDNSLPENLKAEEEYSFSYELKIPDTYKTSKDQSGKTTVDAPAIVPSNCGIVAYIIERATNTVVNSAYHPMSELTEKRFTTADLVEEIAEVEEIGIDESAPAEYYTIDGLRVVTPERGRLYIKRQGSKTTKVIF